MKSFEVDSTTFVKDYRKKRSDLGLIAALCIGVLAFFVLKLAGVI
jgi:hypothetical protein